MISTHIVISARLLYYLYFDAGADQTQWWQAESCITFTAFSYINVRTNLRLGALCLRASFTLYVCLNLERMLSDAWRPSRDLIFRSGQMSSS